MSFRIFPLLCALLLGASAVEARVFLGGKENCMDAAATAAGFQSLYTTQYKINGTDATLKIYGAEVPLDVATDRLATAFHNQNRKVSIPVTDNGAMGVVVDGDELIRLMLIPVAAGKTMICTVHQTIESASNLKATTGRDSKIDMSLPNISAFPGSRLVYYVEDQKTKTTLAVYRAHGTSDTVRDFYSRSLPQNGWQSLSGVMYRRGSLNCVISVQPGQQPGEVTVTLLLRRSAL